LRIEYAQPQIHGSLDAPFSPGIVELLTAAGGTNPKGNVSDGIVITTPNFPPTAIIMQDGGNARFRMR
jgi:hypothetical protein